MGQYKFCPNCGEKLEERFKFCPGCGGNMSSETRSTNAAAANTPKKTAPAEQTQAAPAARVLDNKVTPISADARRVLDMFEEEFLALKEKRTRRQHTFNYAIKSVMTPKVQIALAAVTVLVFTGFVFIMMWVYRVLASNMRGLTH